MHVRTLLLGLVLWSCSTALSARTGKNRQKARHEPTGPQEPRGADGANESESPGASDTDFLADFAGKKRLWVITAPSYADHYLRMMETQIKESEGLNCRLADRDTVIVTIIQNAMMEGKIRHTTMQGQATEEAMDPDMVTKLLHYLELEHQTFSMLVLKKNMKVGERFPYPVRVEAVLEVIDQLPVRKLEKVTRKGPLQKCKITKKRLVGKPLQPSSSKRRIFNSQKQGNTTTVPSQALDKKTVIRNKVKDILSGRSRFIIRKGQVSRSGAKPGEKPGENKEGKPKVDGHKERPDSRVDKAANKPDPASEVEEGKEKENSGLIKVDEEVEGEETVDNPKAKKKGKGKKDREKKKKKGKRGGKKSHQEASNKEKAALKEFIESLKGKRRLLVISSPTDVSSQYIQQRDDNELQSCEFALRKVTVLSILGPEHNPALRLQHYRQEGDPQLAALPDNFKNPDLIRQIRKEYGLKDLSVVVTDYDLKPDLQKVFDLPTATSAILKYIDSFQSRRVEKGQENSCGTSEKNSEVENSLLRFISNRRLLIISAPAEDDYSLHQQHQALQGQECHMGIRHFALLKLVGKGSGASGTIELFPLNGKSQTEKESLSQTAVKNLRDQLKINRDYFSMLVVGKDGDVKVWFNSPMWSTSNIYDLVDSMELRQQEMKLQQTLGIRCAEDDGGGGGGRAGDRYSEETEDSYLYRRSED